MTNPWLTHVKEFRAQHPGMIYKDVLKEAAKTYQKGGSLPGAVSKHRHGPGTMQNGNGPISGLVMGLAKPVSDTIGNIIGAVQQNKRNNGAWQVAKMRKMTRQYNIAKRKMRFGRFPHMPDAALWSYIQRQFA